MAIHDRNMTRTHTVPLDADLGAAMLAATVEGPLGTNVRLFGVEPDVRWEERGDRYDLTGPLHALDALALRVRVWARRELIGDDPRTVRLRDEAAAFTLCVEDLFGALAIEDADRLARNGFRNFRTV